ncbi:MotA/TolQ/ExbB proton channel family protein [Verrucomicrobiota bacterium]
MVCLKRLWLVAVVVCGMTLCVTETVRAQEAGSTGVDASAMNTSAGAGERFEGAVKNLKYLHGAGGPTMYFIDLALVIGVAFILERLVRMRRKRILPSMLLKSAEEHIDKDETDALKDLCAKTRGSTLSKVIQYLVDNPDDPREEREATVNELASRDVDVHRMMCFPLAAIAGLSPLMGLLGTVSGIRECFRDVALAGEMGNPAMLAGGIEKALITTIYGLVVAIITLFCYNMFKFRMNLLANELEEILASIVARYARKGNK